MNKIETVSKTIVKDNAEKYIAFHNEFKKKGLFTKLWLIVRNMGNHLWFKYFSNTSDRFTYTGLLHFLNNKRDNK